MPRTVISENQSPGSPSLAWESERLGLPDLLWILLCVGLATGVFLTGIHGELVYDDLLLIGRNPWITDLSNLPLLFAHPYWDFLDPGTSDQIGYWRPLTAVVQSLAWAVGDGDTWAFHAASLGLHLAATLVAFLLVRRLTGRVAVAGCAALLFGVHPTHVESVAWISAINDPLFGFWALFSLLLFLRWRERPRAGGVAIGAGVAFFIALLSKEMALAVLPLVLAVDLGRRRNPASEAAPPDRRSGILDGLRALATGWRDYRPFLVALGVYLLCRMLVFRDLFAGLDRTPVDFRVSWSRLLALRLELVGGTFSLLSWPVGLRTFRPFRPDLDGFETELFGLAAIVIGAILLGVVLWRRRERLALAALLLIPLGLSPALVNVGSLGRFPLSDRFLYLPVLGFTLLVASALWRWLPSRVATGFALLLAGLYGHASVQRIAVWQNEKVLFESAVRESPRSAYLRWSLGRVYLKELLATDDRKYLDLALANFEQAGVLLEEAKAPRTDLFVSSADFLQTSLGLAHCYSIEGELDDYGSQSTAIAILEDLEAKLIELRDQKAEARRLGIRTLEPDLDLDLVCASLAQCYRLSKRYEEAQMALDRALEHDPRCVEALIGYGRLHAEVERFAEAAGYFARAVELQPGDYESRLLLAQTLRESGENERAEVLAIQLSEEDPTQPEPMLIVATNRLGEQKAREALTWIDRALKAKPEHGFSWYLKAMAMQSLGVNPQATIEAFQRATEYAPDFFPASYNYGTLLLRSGAEEAAIPHLVRAYTLATDPTLVSGLLAAITELPIDSPDTYFAMATADGSRDRLNEAELWLDRALALDPEHSDTLFQKGRLYRSRGRHEEGLDHMRRACAGAPGNIVAFTEFGEYLMREGRMVEAQRVLSSALEFTRPADWDEESFSKAIDLVRKLQDKLEQDLPSSEAIGPPPSSPTSSDARR